MPKKKKVCPRCAKMYTEFPALSRKDNKTYICSACGMAEAFEDARMAPQWSGRIYWHVDPKTGNSNAS